jgi:hypothetical protein
MKTRRVEKPRNGSSNVNDTAVIIFIGVVILVVWFFARKGRTARAETDRQREAAREVSDSLKKINKMLAYPEGQGPTGVMVDGEYRVVNVGHTERMKNDPTYAFGNKVAGILLEMQDLENAQKEAQASGDRALAEKITRQLAVLESEAMTLANLQAKK